VLFDCAGLMAEPSNILDELAQQAAIEALRNSSVVVFCVDISKPDWSEDAAIRKLTESDALIPAATKADLLSENLLTGRLAGLNELFAAEFLPISAETGAGIELLRETIDRKILDTRYSILDTQASRMEHQVTSVALTARHRQTLTLAIENVGESINELEVGNDEVAAMMLRAAYQAIFDIDQHVDDEILERIFSRFCIGK
jgi:tRNA U34 5-carboxymethylaminomethyl modifying GTPase MnmE/TrmE